MGPSAIGAISPLLGEHVERSLQVARADEDVEIFGGADDAGVIGHGVSAPDQVRDAGLIQQPQRSHVEIPRLQVRSFGGCVEGFVEELVHKD